LLNDDGSFSYVPNTEYRGKDSFTYVAHDLDGDSATATVNIQVGKVPVVKDHSYVVPRARDSSSLDPLVVDTSRGLLIDATPGETGTLTVELVSDVSPGALALADDGTFTYTPIPDFHGTDTFTYQAKDGDVPS